jgi:hypothetical protein
LSTSLPGRIYHYTSRSAGRDILKTGSIWASHVRCLNEPAGYSTAFDIANDLISGLAAATADPDFTGLIRQWLPQIPTIGEHHRLVACFSGARDLASQWQSCARDGYALVFDPVALEALTVPSDYMLVECLYARSEHKALCAAAVGDTLEVYRRSIAHGEPQDTAAMNAKRLFEVLISGVMPQIQHEALCDAREYRLVSTTPLKFRPQGQLRNRYRGNLKIPYEAVNFRATGDNRALREVMIAPGADYALAKAELQNVLDGAGYPDVEITRSAIVRLP